MDIELQKTPNQSSYQSIPTTESSAVVHESDHYSSQKRAWLLGVAGFAIFFAVILLARNVGIPSSESTAVSNYGTASHSNNFCKTQCNDPCASYNSVYGSLCCDWNTDAEGGKSCSQAISSSGVCTCGGNPTSSSTAPTNPVPSPATVPAPRPAPVEDSPQKSKPQNDDFWQPMPGWEPMPGWKPFKPITKSPDSTPCKTHCANPCGWSQSGGVSMCCESSDKGCQQSQINGECFCN